VWCIRAECTPEELEREKEETKRTLIRKVTPGIDFTVFRSGNDLISLLILFFFFLFLLGWPHPKKPKPPRRPRFQMKFCRIFPPVITHRFIGVRFWIWSHTSRMSVVTSFHKKSLKLVVSIQIRMNGVGFSMWSHNFKMAAMTSFRADNCWNVNSHRQVLVPGEWK